MLLTQAEFSYLFVDSCFYVANWSCESSRLAFCLSCVRPGAARRGVGIIYETWRVKACTSFGSDSRASVVGSPERIDSCTAAS